MSLPKLQKIANIVDYGALQNDILNVLLNFSPLLKVNMVEERRFLLDSTVDVTSLWMTSRNGGTGAGIIVEMIIANVKAPNLTGPMLDLQIGIVAIEERNLNFTPGTGSFLTSEQIAQLALDALHQQFIAGYGTLQAVGIQPAPDWFDENTGLSAYRAQLRMDNPRSQTPRCAPVQSSVAAGAVTLSCATAASEIYYTTDESFPGRSNPVALLYSEPFAVEEGDIIRFAAYAEGYNVSPIYTLEVTA